MRRRNHELALTAQTMICEAIQCNAPAPANMIGSMAAVPLDDNCSDEVQAGYADPLQQHLLEEHGIEVPVMVWPEPRGRVIRVSVQLYNDVDDFRRLAKLLS